MNQNTLQSALSPYLLQHAEQPVDWQSWGPAALAEARQRSCPILLSIGYSACHWCHVMSRECFENEAIAERMNQHFVNIKLDREERPDLDRIYQQAHQLLTGRGGGWPLTVFLDPDSLAPLYAGTYFPPTARHGLPGFGQLLEQIALIWRDRRAELADQQRQLHQALEALAQPRPGDASMTPELLAETAIAQLASRFDARHGGFGVAPKFPQVPLLELLRARRGDEQAEQMLCDTLEAIVRFGLQDQIGGGFFRYCVDQAWEIPHFEKMLSDNALLLGLLAEAAARWPHRAFSTACHRLVAWLEQDMALAGGGFAASLDADSEDGEGRYYLWTPAAVRQALPAALAELAIPAFGLDGPANVDAQGDHPAWHLVQALELDELTTAARDRAAVDQALALAREKLATVRRARPSPARDDKLIAAWNGLVIEALARAGRLLDQPDWRAQAADSLDAVARRLFGQEPPRSLWRDGRSGEIANLDDHANVLLACLELLSWRFEGRWFNLARRLARRIVAHFIEPDSGVCYFTSDEQTTPLARPLALADEATPAGAAQAVRALSRMAQLCGKPEWLQAAEAAVKAASGDQNAAPLAHAGLIRAGLELDHPAAQVIIGGAGPVPAHWQSELGANPELQIFRIDPAADLDDPPELLAQAARAERPTAWICRGQHCLAPVDSLADLKRALALE